MGTRSLTRVIPRQEGLSYSEGHNKPELSSVNMYQQYDGHPYSWGVELAKFLNEFKIVNGLGFKERSKKLNEIANGTHCLAAQLVREFKNAPGYTYLYPTSGEIGDYGEEYIYTVYPKTNSRIYIAIYDAYAKEVIFVGTPDELIKKYSSNVDLLKSLSSYGG